MQNDEPPETPSRDPARAAAAAASEPSGAAAWLVGEPPRVDVEAVMATVRARVEEKRRAGVYRDLDWLDDPAFLDSAQAGGDALALLRATAAVDLRGEEIRSHRPVIGAAVVAAKGALRWLVRKYTDALFVRQGAFNAEAVKALTALQAETAELRQRLERLKGPGGAE